MIRQHIPEDNSEHHTRRRENLKSHTLNWLYVWRYPRHWRRERASEAAEVQAIEVIKCSDILAQIAAVASTDTDVERSLLVPCVHSRRIRQTIRSLVIVRGHCFILSDPEQVSNCFPLEYK
jgi:hypothetical protein